MGTKAELLPSIKRLFPSQTLRFNSPRRRLVFSSLLLFYPFPFILPKMCLTDSVPRWSYQSLFLASAVTQASLRMPGGRRATTAQVKCARCSWQKLFNMVAVSLMTPDHGTDGDSEAQGKENSWKTGTSWPASSSLMQTRTRKHCWQHSSLQLSALWRRSGRDIKLQSRKI